MTMDLRRACQTFAEEPRIEPAPPEPQLASLGCATYKTYQTCDAQPACMWAGLPLGCINRVE